MFILIILSLSYPYMPYVSLNYVLCWCFVVMYINCIVVYGRISCKTASSWWVILVKYVLIKKKKKKWKGFGWTRHTYATVANFYFCLFSLFRCNAVVSRALPTTPMAPWFPTGISPTLSRRLHSQLRLEIEKCSKSRNFQILFFKWQLFSILIRMLLKLISECPIWNMPAFGSGSGLVSKRGQVIIWTSDGVMYFAVWNITLRRTSCLCGIKYWIMSETRRCALFI